MSRRSILNAEISCFFENYWDIVLMSVAADDFCLNYFFVCNVDSFDWEASTRSCFSARNYVDVVTDSQCWIIAVLLNNNTDKLLKFASIFV